ncbi:MAG: hypothetical protein KF770_25525 [Anaerolineae bacterium]|nr:hypothetical protein [Anaerolineae bacterium]
MPIRLVGVGEWLKVVGQTERAVDVLTAVAQDPRVNIELKERAVRGLTAVPPTDHPALTDTFQLAATLAAELEHLSIP